jgi:cytidylate kinase
MLFLKPLKPYNQEGVPMPIITISRGSYYHGKSVAEKLASKLGYHCTSRDQILENLEEFRLPEIKLVRGLNDAFSVLDRFPHGKDRFTAAVRSAILQQLLAGNIVYHGLFGHHFVSNISHVLKVRIITDTKSRVADEMARENITEEKARYVLKKDDEERRKWGMFLYGIDIVAPENYNLVIRIGHLAEDDAVDLIAKAVSLPSFRETTESRKALADSALTALVGRALFDFPHASVTARDGHVSISLKVPNDQRELINDRIGRMVSTIEGVQQHTIHFDPYF